MSVAKRILLVDDDGDLREALAEQLVMIEDFDVYEAETGNGMTGSSAPRKRCTTW